MAIATVPQIRPIHPLFGAEVGGVDLKHVHDETFARVRAAFEGYSVLVSRDQRLTDEEQIAFSYVASPASHIGGMPVDDGRALICRLLDFATQPERVYRHTWTRGDLVMWDNRAAQYRRMMRRTTVAGEGPTA